MSTNHRHQPAIFRTLLIVLQLCFGTELKAQSPEARPNAEPTSSDQTSESIQRGQASLFGFGIGNRTRLRPRGRIVDSRLSLLAIDSTQLSSPRGLPR